MYTKAILVHSRLVREGEFKAARMLYRAMLRRATKINMPLADDTAWFLARFFPKNNGYFFTIKN